MSARTKRSLPLAGRTALVTGGNAGIGLAVCNALLARGARVIAAGLAPALPAHPLLTSVVADLSTPDGVAALVAAVAPEPRLDILVNNAGVVRNTALAEVGDAEFDLMMNLHARCAMQLAQACLPRMRAQHFGRIVNVASRAIVGLAGRTAYGASKAALAAMTRTWALELGPFGITVNTVSPGPTVTGMLASDFPEHGQRARALAASLPARRLGLPDDVARAVLFFADPASSWITGQNLFVCGGGSLAASLAL
ncbi:Short-chain dehydrogenase/reductase SDR [Cupriavidus taiwanensis]|uniref:Short-chain dehydrogenase/reductase SDR n=1 Tax=Cupriavidus taiwanensis TaxID=164546 RepID=A0A375E5L2_9BURK|nr:SDR family oxidoreductase [Cupriavidus taiwanensis]SOZ59830.1 Short-chain dehydrogenase/reductase SDR [Cupriavidus taiwanensis]SOZ60060.1 Short-chain dehydrogenase/reductase SDR [Cupriavidus taiwanensis]SOZ63731.1 Short-chain dehydrogenase/reductase SDR [Cupriavidus taiwanensis]SPA06516.1 Short-chain dehydrogenase/reductase SDR [Cupriavidus taiwanensis]